MVGCGGHSLGTPIDDQIEAFRLCPKKPSSDAGPCPRTVIVHKQNGIVGIQG